MSSFEIGAARPVGAIQPGPAKSATTGPAMTAAVANFAASSATPRVETSMTASAGTVPVDQDRVTQIHEAIRNGSYPMIPTRIGDAMIAAGALLRKAP